MILYKKIVYVVKKFFYRLIIIIIMNEISCVYTPCFLLKSYNDKIKSIKPSISNLSNNYEFKLNKNINGITIDNETGIVSFDNCIDIGKYKILIKLLDKEKRRKIYLKYFLVVVDNNSSFKNDDLITENSNLLSNDNIISYDPYFLIKSKNEEIYSVKPNIKLKDKDNYEFIFEKSYKGIYLNPDNGIISFNDKIEIGKYILTIILQKKDEQEIIGKTLYYLIVTSNNYLEKSKKIILNTDTELLSTDYYNIDIHNSGELSSREFVNKKLKIIKIDDSKINHIEVENSCIADKVINNLSYFIYSKKISNYFKNFFDYFNLSSEDNFKSDDFTIFIISLVLILVYKIKFTDKDNKQI
jgi:hypothetical protein